MLIHVRLAPKKSGDQEAQALGRSRGGFSTKIHATVDSLGNLLRLQLTAGQESDIGQAVSLVEGLDFERVIAHRDYASQAFYEWVARTGNGTGYSSSSTSER